MSSTILLVEDNPDDAELTRLALDRLGKYARVVVLGDGAQVMDYLADDLRVSQVRVIILDVKLPKMDGIQVLAKLKSGARTRSIPVVMLSSSTRGSDIAQCYEAGANSFVVKPVELDDYLDKISALARYWDEVNQPPPVR
ncbi:MAG TPA: response regulator [Burkholderiales bacterium]|nr:response regulator [Burkholderiales bacterium]